MSNGKTKSMEILFEAGVYSIILVYLLLLLTTATHTIPSYFRARINAWSQLVIAAERYCCVVLMVFLIAVGVNLWFLSSWNASLQTSGKQGPVSWSRQCYSELIRDQQNSLRFRLTSCASYS